MRAAVRTRDACGGLRTSATSGVRRTLPGSAAPAKLDPARAAAIEAGKIKALQRRIDNAFLLLPRAGSA